MVVFKQTHEHNAQAQGKNTVRNGNMRIQNVWFKLNVCKKYDIYLGGMAAFHIEFNFGNTEGKWTNTRWKNAS